jgi:Fic family protein
VPDSIGEIQPLVSFETSAIVHAAEEATAALNETESVAGLEAVGPLLLRSEAVASSKIERLAVSQLNLARALVDPRSAKGTARAVAANVLALERAVAIGDAEAPLAVVDLVEIHRILMADDDPEDAGIVRTEQNWIGGRQPSPVDAAYVPPPPEEVPALLDDLIAFLRRDDLPPVVQAAIAHAQFETIHPFADGNGRVGRSLIHLVLRRRGLAPRFVPPVSMVLAAHPDAYVAGLVGFREAGGLEPWIASFAEASGQAAAASKRLAEAVRELEEEWFEEAGRPRRDGAPAKIIRLLPAQPILTAATARLGIGTSYEAARIALLALEKAGVVHQISGGTYDRTYAADRLFDLIRRYEERTLSG